MNRRILLVAVAVVLALIGTVAVYSYAKSADNRAVADTRAATVLVTTSRIPAGTSWADVVKGTYLKQEHLPADAAPSSALTNINTAGIGSDAVAEADIAPGQILLREAFGPKTPKTGVLSIPKGDIAISVELPASSDVAGYVAPGSQVIIFVTTHLDTKNPAYKLSTGQDLTVNRTVVPRAGVLATSTSVPTEVAGNNDGTGSTSGGSALITLALSQKDAQRVIMAQHIGDLYLGLLSASSKVSQDGGLVNAGDFKPVPMWLQDGPKP